MTLTPAARSVGSGWLSYVGIHAEHDVARGAAVEDDPALGELGDQRRILDRADAVVDPRDRQRQRRADALGSGPLAGVDRAAEPRGGRDRIRLGELRARGNRPRRRPSRSRPRTGAARSAAWRATAIALLDAEVPHRRDQDPALDPVVAARVIDPLRDPVRGALRRSARPLARDRARRSARRRSRPPRAHSHRYS